MTIAVLILAGGESQRMGDFNKVILPYKEKRMIEHVIDGIQPQIEEIYLSAPEDFSTSLPFILDHHDGPKGPAGGIYAAWQWFKNQRPEMIGFVTIPADGPNIANDIVKKLTKSRKATFAQSPTRSHRTYAYWPMTALENAWPDFIDAKNWSLYRLAAACQATPVIWDTEEPFFNINTPEDLQNI